MYGTKTFAVVPSKNKSNKKKNSKKQKVKPSKAVGRSKSKNSELTPKYNNKKVTDPVPSDVSPYFYAVNLNKFKTSEEGVKPYLKFVKNITITYPVIIPARDSIKFNRKTQKQKEKSRDINSNRNLNPLPVRTTTAVTTKGKNAGNCL